MMREHAHTTASLPLELHASACGKAIIVGEHAVVYGTRAVAMPLPSMRFRFSLRPISTLSSFPKIQLLLDGKEVSERMQAVVSQAMQLLEIPAFSLLGKSHSDLPIGAGLGSSATLCVAILRALAQLKDQELSSQQLAYLANELEKSFHGNPSGLDAAVVAYESCILFAKGGPIQVLNLPQHHGKTWNFMLIDSGLRASTKTMIRIAEPYFTGPGGEANLQAFDSLALSAHKALESADFTLAADAMNICDRLLRDAGVVPTVMGAMIDEIRSLGAIGVKSTGAGGGGMILALLPEEAAEETALTIQSAFAQNASFRVHLP